MAAVYPLLRPWVESVAPDDLQLIRVAEYTFRAQVANHWRRDNMFILGDAAIQTLLKRLLQRCQLGLPLFKQTQTLADDLARRCVGQRDQRREALHKLAVFRDDTLRLVCLSRLAWAM